jgi:hypothetical protein
MIRLDLTDIKRLQNKFVEYTTGAEPALDFSLDAYGNFKDFRVMELWVTWFRACLSTVQLINEEETHDE